jgi:hypothetical protein
LSSADILDHDDTKNAHPSCGHVISPTAGSLWHRVHAQPCLPMLAKNDLLPRMLPAGREPVSRPHSRPRPRGKRRSGGMPRNETVPASYLETHGGIPSALFWGWRALAARSTRCDSRHWTVKCKQDVRWRSHWIVKVNETVLKLGGGTLQQFVPHHL